MTKFTTTKKVALAVAAIALATAALLPRGAAQGTRVTMYKNPGCECCTRWAAHMEENGFTVEVDQSRPLSEVSAQHGVTSQVASCHVALVEGYVVVGHVPAAEVRNLLEERPNVAGISVPGMPQGSPGMEVPGAPPARYNVVAFDGRGGIFKWATY